MLVAHDRKTQVRSSTLLRAAAVATTRFAQPHCYRTTTGLRLHVEVLIDVVTGEILRANDLALQLSQSDLHTVEADCLPLAGVFHLEVD